MFTEYIFLRVHCMGKQRAVKYQDRYIMLNYLIYHKIILIVQCEQIQLKIFGSFTLISYYST